MDLVVLALVEDGANMDNPLDLSEVFLRFRLRNPGLADNWMDVDISRCVKAGKLWRRVSRLDTYLFHQGVFDSCGLTGPFLFLVQL